MVNGRKELIEGLAMPREEIEFGLTWYNTLTNWLHLDSVLEAFGLDRTALLDEQRVRAGVRAVAQKMPTYVTMKEVKKRWGRGQEDVFPITQFEKLWGDMTKLHTFETRFLAVERPRGQQLKDQAQLDSWRRDGSSRYAEDLCSWG